MGGCSKEVPKAGVVEKNNIPFQIHKVVLLRKRDLIICRSLAFSGSSNSLRCSGSYSLEQQVKQDCLFLDYHAKRRVVSQL